MCWSDPVSSCRWSSLVLLGCLLSAGPGCRRAPSPADHEPSAAVAGFFEEITERAGIEFHHQLADGDLSNIMESDGAGGTVLDYDGDGLMDLYFVNSGPDPVISDAPAGTERWPNRLYRNRGDGTFEDRTEPAGVAGHGFGIAAAAADYDNDGDTDLYVVNAGSSILYQNQGDGTFREVTELAGVQNDRAGIAATFLDIDLDGYLDLFVANYLVYDPAVPNPPGATQPYPGPLSYEPEFNILFRNRGDGTFENVSDSSGILIPGHRAMSVTPFDFDLDGDQDLYVSNDATANLLLVNDGHGRFRDEALERGAAVNQFGQAGGSMAATVGDCDGDGRPDLFITRFERASLYMNSPGGLFEDRILASGILSLTAEYVAWGGNFFDLDNDGDLDLFVANGDPHFLRGQPSLLLENDGAGRFTDAGPRGGPFFGTRVNARGSAAVDLDNDGRLDLVLSTLADRPVLLRNRADTGHNWLMLELEGTQSNRDGLGAWVKVTAGTHSAKREARCPTGYVFQEDPRLHFGLGTNTQADRIEIQWPSGVTQVLTQIPANQILTVREPGDSRWAAAP